MSKNNHPNYLQKITAYSALSASFLVLATDADAQTINYNYSPDSLIGWDLAFNDGCSYDYEKDFELDIDKDGINDIRLSFTNFYSCSSSGYSEKGRVRGLNGVEVMAISAGTAYYFSTGFAVPLGNGDIVGSGAYWNNGWATFQSDDGYAFGYWPFETEAAFGLRFPIGGGNYRYGWVSIDYPLNITRSVTLIRSQVNAIPNASVAVDFSMPDLFCERPTTLNALPSLTGTSVALDWNAVPGADKYVIRGRKTSAPNYGQVIESSNSRSFGGLTPGSSYVWNLRTACTNGGVSAQSFEASFSTVVLRSSNDLPTAEVAVYSFNDVIYIGSTETEIVSATITNLAGHMLMDRGGRWQQMEIQTDYPAGIYFIEIRDSKDRVARHKIYLQ